MSSVADDIKQLLCYIYAVMKMMVAAADAKGNALLYVYTYTIYSYYICQWMLSKQSACPQLIQQINQINMLYRVGEMTFVVCMPLLIYWCEDYHLGWPNLWTQSIELWAGYLWPSMSIITHVIAAWIKQEVNVHSRYVCHLDMWHVRFDPSINV